MTAADKAVGDFSTCSTTKVAATSGVVPCAAVNLSATWTTNFLISSDDAAK